MSNRYRVLWEVAGRKEDVLPNRWCGRVTGTWALERATMWRAEEVGGRPFRPRSAHSQKHAGGREPSRPRLKPRVATA